MLVRAKLVIRHTYCTPLPPILLTAHQTFQPYGRGHKCFSQLMCNHFKYVPNGCSVGRVNSSLTNSNITERICASNVVQHKQYKKADQRHTVALSHITNLCWIYLQGLKNAAVYWIAPMWKRQHLQFQTATVVTQKYVVQIAILRINQQLPVAENKESVWMSQLDTLYFTTTTNTSEKGNSDILLNPNEGQ